MRPRVEVVVKPDAPLALIGLELARLVHERSLKDVVPVVACGWALVRGSNRGLRPLRRRLRSVEVNDAGLHQLVEDLFRLRTRLSDEVGDVVDGRSTVDARGDEAFLQREAQLRDV